MTSGTMYSGYGCQKRIYWDVNKVVNYFKHDHYGFQFISASCKCRPIKVCKHLRDTSVTVSQPWHEPYRIVSLRDPDVVVTN